MKRQIFLNANFAGCVPHSPRASDMRGPVPDPLPPLGHNTRSPRLFALLWLFSCLGLSRAHPASFPCPARASRKRCSALTWITKATPARAVSPAVFRFGCRATMRRPDALKLFQGLNQGIHVKTTSVLKKFTLLYAFIRTG